MARGKKRTIEDKSSVVNKKHGNVARKLIDDRYTDHPELTVLVSQTIRSLMRDGKGSLARKILYTAMSESSARLTEQHKAEIGEYTDARDLEAKMLQLVIDKITPKVEVKTKRVGGANYQVPMVVNRTRGLTLALRWLVSSARERSEGASMIKKLANEFIETLDGRSASLSKKETQDKMAMANRANANLARRDNSAQQREESNS